MEMEFQWDWLASELLLCLSPHSAGVADTGHHVCFYIGDEVPN